MANQVFENLPHGARGLAVATDQAWSGWWLGLGLVIALLVAATLWWFWYRGKRRDTDQVDAQAAAWNELEAHLKQLNKLPADHVQAVHYGQLSQVLRMALAHNRGRATMSSTTQELVRVVELGHTPLKAREAAAVAAVLTTAEQVYFGQRQPAEDVWQEHLKTVKDLTGRIRPVTEAQVDLMSDRATIDLPASQVGGS